MGAVGFFEKSYEPEELLAAVRSALDRWQPRSRSASPVGAISGSRSNRKAPLYKPFR